MVILATTAKTHTKSGQCRAGGRGNNGGRRYVSII